MYDLHTHSTHSDGKNSVEEMCREAIDKGMTGLALTDHADMYNFEQQDTLTRIQQALADLAVAKETFAGQLTVLSGVELGEYRMAPEKAEQVLALPGLDVVLYSEHFVPTARWDKAYSRIAFSEDGTDEEIANYMARYFEIIAQTVGTFDFDVLAHLTCPARYITGRHKRPTDVMLYRDTVTDILKTIIARDIALELNTCGRCCQSFGYYDAQNEEILALYTSLGGRRVTLGSDSHTITGIGRGFAEAKEQLRRFGLDRYYYYQDRKPIAVAL